jgi:asparagine synthase (glutamine-hydrolysing)
MFTTDNRYVILLNGEIYNYIELKEELKAKGYVFRSATDTEVLLYTYIEWGEECLYKLNGMFAFIVFDTVKNEIFAARDRFGIKPFYYYHDNGRFMFASDIPPLLRSADECRKPDDQIIFDYLLFNRTNHTTRTFFRKIKKLQHGHALTIKGSKVSIYRWYDLKERVAFHDSLQFRGNEFLAELEAAVNLQLRSDVPVGTCLSGGIDSSAITSLVLRNRQNIDLHSFSAVYGKGQKGDESEYIAEYKDKNIRIHYTYPTDDSLLDDLGRFISSQSEPVPTTSIYAEFKVMELAKEYCTVLLNGQGADEMMAGYHYFYGYFFRDLIKAGSWGKFLNELYRYLSTQRSIFGIKSLGFSLNPRSLKHFRSHNHIDGAFYNSYYDRENALFDVFYKSDSLKEFLLNHFEYKFEHHLLWADKTGMQFSLETRFPFLDHNLVEKTLSIPVDNYISNGYTKVIMRNSMKGILPEKIRMRKDKIGFSTPEADWFRKAGMQDLLGEVITSESFKNRGYFNARICMSEYMKLKKSGIYNSEFWKWINLELWFRKYID